MSSYELNFWGTKLFRQVFYLAIRLSSYYQEHLLTLSGNTEIQGKAFIDL